MACDTNGLPLADVPLRARILAKALSPLNGYPELALGLAVLLVDYYIDRNKTATRSHTKTWMARHKNVRLLPL